MGSIILLLFILTILISYVPIMIIYYKLIKHSKKTINEILKEI
jgi:hypothetical protein